MHMACSSVLYGGGTNQELAHHCLYECKGDIMVSVTEQFWQLAMTISRFLLPGYLDVKAQV